MFLRVFLAFTLLCGLTACESVQAFSNKVEQSFSGLFEPLDTADGAKIAAGQNACPEIQAIDELSSYSQFSGNLPWNTDKLASRVIIESTTGACIYDKESVSMQIDIALAGALGPRARARAGDRPNFAYPYFVAVSDSKGEIMAKEIFAANMAYGQTDNQTRQLESIHQNLPGLTDKHGGSYKILVGFQLSQDQLAYNRGRLQPAAGR